MRRTIGHIVILGHGLFSYYFEYIMFFHISRQMNWAGKIIGALAGYLVAGPAGSLFGLLVGHFFDQGWLSQYWKSPFASPQSYKKQGVFFNATFQVMGYVAKADGRVSEKEVQQARRVMMQMGLDDPLKREAIRLFTAGKRGDFNLSLTLLQLKAVCRFQPMLLRSFLEVQWEMARADSPVIHPQKLALLQNVAEQLGVAFSFTPGGTGTSGAYGAYQEQAYQRANDRTDSRGGRRRSDISLEEAYRELGVSPSANDAQIKQAYRRLMSKHHPDKLIARGESAESIKQATQKTQAIKRAYEKIQETRSSVHTH